MENKFTEEQINEIFLDAVEKCEKLFCTGQNNELDRQAYCYNRGVRDLLIKMYGIKHFERIIEQSYK